MSDEVVVRMGELAVSTQPNCVLTALGLGSCIGVCVHDPMTRISGMAHVVLPAAVGKPDGVKAKSADVGIPNLLEAMISAGAEKRRLRIALAGGAQLFGFQKVNTNMDIGRRNVDAVISILMSMRLTPVATEVGGSKGRTMRFHACTGRVTVRCVGETERLLVDLSSTLLLAA